MASKYTYPSESLRWFIHQNKLAIVTTDVINTAVVVNNIFAPIDESLTDALLVYYNGSVPKLDIASKTIHKQEPDINRRLHGALVSYVLSRLYGDKSEMNEADIISANRHYMTWRKRLGITNGGKMRYTGPKIPIPDKRTALR